MTSSVLRLVERNRGVVSTRQLQSIGVDRPGIDRLRRAGVIEPIRHGWYASPFADARVRAAVVSGTVVTCVSALRLAGIWVPDDGRHHTRGPRAGPVGTCRPFGRPTPLCTSIDEPEVAVGYAARCLDSEAFVVVCDSLIETRTMTIEQIEAAVSRAPERVVALLDRCDGGAQSGTESMVRLRLRARQIQIRSQVHVAGVGRVDFVVGTSLVIEVDSRAHHTGALHYERDRERDRRLVAMGYVVLRLTYQQVVAGWADVDAAITDLVRRRAHRRPVVSEICP